MKSKAVKSLSLVPMLLTVNWEHAILESDGSHNGNNSLHDAKG